MPVQTGRRHLSVGIIGAVLLGASSQPASAQQSVSDVLSFLLTNRSIATGDFVHDERAAGQTRDTISGFLVLELATLPVSSSSGGFSYRLNPILATPERSSDSFGPFFIERSLTAGTHQGSVGLSYQKASFDRIDGHSLRDGTLVATATKFRDQPQPFDVETLSLRIRTNTLTVLANYGVTDRFDFGVVLPIVSLDVSGERIDTYYGNQFLQARASATASGLGDIAIRGKYNALRSGGSGLAVGGEVRLPSGDQQNLLGAGEAAVKPLLIGSVDRGRFAAHINLGYTFSHLSNQINYGGAVTVAGTDRVTFVGELAGRHVVKLGTLTEVSEPNPRIVGVDTIRLLSVGRGTESVVAVAGFKWNLTATLLLSGTVLLPVTTTGLIARWMPGLALDYSFGR
jgi:hypothetical protein